MSDSEIYAAAAAAAAAAAVADDREKVESSDDDEEEEFASTNSSSDSEIEPADGNSDREPESVSSSSLRRRKGAPTKKKEVAAPVASGPQELQNPAVAVAVVCTAMFIVLVGIAIYVTVTRLGEAGPRSVFVGDHIANADFASGLEYEATRSTIELFVRGYALIQDVCRIVIAGENRIKLPGAARPDTFTDLSALPGQPYFCVNNLLNGYAGEDVLKMRERQAQRWHDTSQLRERIPANNVELAEQILDAISFTRSARGDDDESRLNFIDDTSRVAISNLGYLESVLLYRDVGALAGRKPSAIVRTMYYDKLYALAVKLIEEMAELDRLDKETAKGKSACVCGPHLGIARSVVVVATARNAKIYFEPKILPGRGTPELLTHPTGPGGTAPHTPIAVNLDYADGELQRRLKMSGSHAPYYEEIDIEMIRLEATDDGVRAHNYRSMDRVSGDTARCVQYCYYMAYALMDTTANALEESERLFI